MDGLCVLLGCKRLDDEVLRLAREITELLAREGIKTAVCGSGSSEKIGAINVSSPAECTHVITLGGDGTILKWGKTAAKYDLPLLGVNMGRLGFMATLETTELDRIPELLAHGRESRRMLLDCEFLRGGVSDRRTVLNDVVLSHDSGSKLPEFVIYCGDTEATRLRADGVILSTPTGSTAYSLSAGGPILAPDLECIEFTALCPHTLFNRPMVFSSSKTVTVKVRNYQNSRVFASFDGDGNFTFSEDDELRLTRSEKSLRLIKAGGGFFGAVRDKLMAPLK